MNPQQAIELALKHHQNGRLMEAAGLYREVLEAEPKRADALHLLGVVAQQQRRCEESVDLIRRAIAISPQSAVYHCNLGIALDGLGRKEEALSACNRALALKPDYAKAMNTLAIVLTGMGRLDEAVIACQRAIRIQPGSAETYRTLGNVLTDLGRFDEAVTACRRAIQLQPGSAEAYNGLGIALAKKQLPHDAVAAYRRATELKPDFAEPHNNLGIALNGMAQIEEAVESYQRAIAIVPNDASFHSNLIYSLHFHPAKTAITIREEHERWNGKFAAPLRSFHRPHNNERDPDRRLRVGYVSPDFWGQAESYFVVPLFEAHNHLQFEIHAYASVRRPDDTTERLRRSVSAWHDVLEMDNEALAEKIRHDGMDILVDLTMHMGGGVRLPVFARKPAPVQVTWLAYPGSTGLREMDYRITDSFMDPPGGSTEGYSEESIRLPDSWCCYDPLCDIPPSPVQTAHWGRFIRFGSLNNFCKNNHETLRIWARVLGAVPGSRLLLMAARGGHRDSLCRTLERMGVEGSRIEFAESCPREEYLRLYDQIDIALDPLPYNGITTTCDALWMGVPVVSLAGNTAAGRAGLGLLSTAGLPELATGSEEEFTGICSSLAHDLPRLGVLRSTIRRRLLASPLSDFPGFARNMESAYRSMWRKWCEMSATGSK